jgi:hypothetical protein
MKSLHTEGSWDSDDQRLASLDLLAQIDFVARGVLNQNINVGNLVADLNKSAGGAVE